MKVANKINSKANLWKAMLDIESDEKNKSIKSWIIDCWLFLRRRVTILKCKGFKDLSHVFVICSVIGVDQFLMISLPFY